MGIRFRCHICNQPMNVKEFQAGRRGRCPNCRGSFRIPSESTQLSIPLEESKPNVNRVAASALFDESDEDIPHAVPSAVAVEEVQLSPKENARAVSTSGTAKPKRVPQEPSREEMPSVGAPPQATPALLLQNPDALWFVRPPGGGQYGPANTKTLLDWIEQRRVTPETHLWRDGMDTWGLASNLIPEVFGLPSATPDAPAPVMPPPAEPAASLEQIASKGSVASARAVHLQRKKRKQMRSWLIIGLLVLIAVTLVATLVVILWRK